MDTRQYNSRQNIRRNRRNRLLSRALYYQRGTSFHSDGLLSPNGLSASSERGGKAQEERENTRRWGLRMKFLKTHPLAFGYCTLTLIIGILWQVGFNG